MNNMFCIVCGNQKLKLVKHSVRDYDDVDVYQCQCCGHRFLHPLPDENRLQAYYDQDTQTKAVYNSKSINLRKIMANSRYDTARRVELLHKETSNNKQPLVLEIGCGYGFFIRETERLGYNIEGIEISASRRRIARRLCNSDIYHYNLVNEIPDEMIGKYDVIVMFQVLEHIPEPVLFLKNVGRLLKKTGKLIIEVPNLDDHLLNLNEEYFNFFYQTAHVSYYSPKSLRILLGNCGYKSVDITGCQRYSIVNMMNWIINRKPQIDAPAYMASDGIRWLDDYYKQKLINELKSDTIIAITSK